MNWKKEPFLSDKFAFIYLGRFFKFEFHCKEQKWPKMAKNGQKITIEGDWAKYNKFTFQHLKMTVGTLFL